MLATWPSSASMGSTWRDRPPARRPQAAHPPHPSHPSRRRRPDVPDRYRHVPARRVMSMPCRLLTGTRPTVRASGESGVRRASGRSPDDRAVHPHLPRPGKRRRRRPARGCPRLLADVQPTPIIGIRTEPAHDEAYTTITKAQSAYPAILAAYDAVASSPEVVAVSSGRQAVVSRGLHRRARRHRRARSRSATSRFR